MKKLINTRFILATVCLLNTSIPSIAQGGEITVFNSNMRSKAANKFYEEEFRTVGVYRVKGNPYLMKGNNVSDLFSTIGYGANLSLVYDTYTQQVAVMQPDKKSVVNLSLDEVDSFYMKIDNDKVLTGPMMFKNMTKIDPSVKSYMQELVQGGKYSLYKSYYADMKNAAMDVAQTNLKEFEIRSDFYFVDNSKAADRKLVKIKGNLKNLKEYFKAEPEALKILDNDAFALVEQKLMAFFDTLNAK
jgi:hypothetical protein